MVGLDDNRKAMQKHLRLGADGLNAKRLTPQGGYVSFCAVFDLSGNDDTPVSPYSSQIKSASKIKIILFDLFKNQDTERKPWVRRGEWRVKQRRRQMHGFPSQGAGVLPVAYHPPRRTPLSHHDNPSGIFRQQMPKLFLIEPLTAVISKSKTICLHLNEKQSVMGQTLLTG